jgi:hypothetical protein
LNGCIAALNGWLCRIWVPAAAETMNKASYFSGHYQCHGLNVQAACEASCRYIFLSIRCPGGTGDSKMMWLTMPKAILLIPYSGSDKRYLENDVFNFYLSQLRIKIDKALFYGSMFCNHYTLLVDLRT